MKKEYKLILLSVLVDRTSSEEEELARLFSEPIDWELVGGQILNHRLSGYFIGGLKKELKNRIPREIEKAIELLVLAQKKQTLDIISVTKPVLDILDKEGIRYAGLKGLVFNAGLYKPGDRRSNDIDLLVYEEDLDKLNTILRECGYIQTYMPNGEYKEASRKAKLVQRLNYHDLVPYVKLFDSEFIQKHEFDINFHFDSKENDITAAVLDYGTVVYENEYCKVKGLPWETNLAHLCVHLYREATNSLWTSGKRDVVLYKVVDIMNTIRSCKDKDKIHSWTELMIRLNLQKAAFYTLFVLSQFYEDDIVKMLMDRLNPEDTTFLYEVRIDGESRVEKRTQSFLDSAFDLKC